MLLADMLAQGKELGQVHPDVAAPDEAAFLVAGADGLQSAVLLGQRTPEETVALIDRQLDRVFRPRPAG